MLDKISLLRYFTFFSTESSKFGEDFIHKHISYWTLNFHNKYLNSMEIS